MQVKHPEVAVKLTGENGNVFNLMAIITRAMKKSGLDNSVIQEFKQDIMTSHSYDEAIAKMMNWVEIE